jgi:shikimate dehydrogenase
MTATEANGDILLAVTGNPVLHSKSPQIMNAALAASGTAGRYVRIAADTAAEALELMRMLGIRGLNVTAPFKQDMIPLLDEVDQGARTIGGANTILALGDGRRAGWNTDDRGVVNSFAEAGVPLVDSKVAVLGAGGAARGAVYGLVAAGARVTVVNRTLGKAANLARLFGCDHAPMEEVEQQVREADIVLSTLSPNIRIVQPEWLSPRQIVFDANYKGSQLSELAEAAGCRSILGIDWLVNQAIPAFETFTGGKTCPASVMYEALERRQKGFPGRIAVIGFMGCGKSRNGRRLARDMDWRFHDLDEAIERDSGKTIPQLFEREGERAFRQMEAAALRRVADHAEVVVACGGGIVTSEENRRILREDFLCVWLAAGMETIMSRTAGSSRPLLAGASPRATAERLTENRRMMYAECADLVVSTEASFQREAYEKIHAEIRSTFDC